MGVISSVNRGVCLLALVAASACGGSQVWAGSNVVCGSGTQQSGKICILSPPDASGLSCGPGTVQVGNECLPEGGGPVAGSDGGPVAGSDAGFIVGQPVGEDAGTSDEAGTQSTNFGIDAAHHNAQPFDVVVSPLTPAWTLHFNGSVGYPLIVHGLAIVAVREQPPNVRAVDLQTGTPVWGPVSTGLPAIGIAYDGGSVFVLDGGGNLAAFDALTGTAFWTKTLPVPFLGVSPPVASGGIVYVNSLGSDNATHAFDARDGTLLWHVPARSGSDGAVAVGGGEVYSAEVCRTLFVLDARTGKLNLAERGDCLGDGGRAPAVYRDAIWERDLADGNAIVGLAGETRGEFGTNILPAFHGDTAFYLGSNDKLVTALSAVDIATNLIEWSFAGDGHLCTSAAVAGGAGQVFVGSSSGNVYELDEATGSVRSVHNAGSAVLCGSETMSMALGAGHLLVPATNTLIAY